MSREQLLYNFLEGREEEKPDVMTIAQINQTLQDIEDMHPMREAVKLDDILKFLRVFRQCKKKPKPHFKQHFRKALLEELCIAIPESELELMEEPFLMLGYGINSYFDIMKQIMFMFMFITIVLSPVYYIYSSNNVQGMDQYMNSTPGPNQALSKLTMGNIGAATVLCKSWRIRDEGGILDLKCPNGQSSVQMKTLNDDDEVDVKYGLMTKDLPLKTFCTPEALEHHQDESNEEKDECTEDIRHVFIKNQLKECHNKSECRLNFTDPRMIMTQGKYDPDGQCGKDAFLFVQVPCILSDTEMSYRKEIGLFIGCLSIFIYLYTLVYLDYIQVVQKLKFIDFDVKTITAGDYTIEFDLEEDIYDNFLQNYFDPTNPISECAQFKLYVQLELEKRLSAMPDLGYEEEEQELIKIAQITFAYDNNELINALKSRGQFIKTEKWKKVKEINKNLAQMIRDPYLLNKFQKPVSVFASFESEEGRARALVYNETILQKDFKHFQKFLGSEIEIQEASEPTDIIWENRPFTPKTRNIKRVFVYFTIIIMLTLSGSVIFNLTKKSLSLKQKYPKVNCDNIESSYGEKEDQWMQEANEELKANLDLEQNNEPTQYQGAMQCFCLFQKKKDALFTLEKTFLISQNEENQICKLYFDDKKQVSVLGGAISGFIVAINEILKQSIIALITWVGEDTISEQLSSITNGVFYAQFFNTGILLLLVNANLSEHQPSIITQHIQGPFHDYLPEWYGSVGDKIVQTMIINSILPYVGLVTGAMIPKIKQCLDNGFSGNPYKTKKTAVAGYKDLYSGGSYVIHFKYAGVLNVVFITMFYGIGMPILFPIAAFNMFNQYCCERIIVAYQMRLPPALDDRLTLNAINMMKYAPLILLMNCFWMVTNRQIFENKWNWIQKTTETMKSDHLLKFDIMSWANPVLFMICVGVILQFILKLFQSQLQRFGWGMTSKDINVDEDLPNFFKCVKFSQASELIKEQENMKENYGFIHNDPDTVELLTDIGMPEKSCQGSPWYQILSNSKYANEFFYIGANVVERENIIEDGFAESENKEHASQEAQIRCEQSDLLMVLMNISFIPDEIIYSNVIKDFEPGWQYYLKQAMMNYKEDYNKNVSENSQHIKELWFKAVKCSDDFKNKEMEYVKVNPNEKDEDGKKLKHDRDNRYIDILRYDKKWEYQNRELEDRYEEFKKKRDLVLQPGLNMKLKTTNIKKIFN